MNENKLNNIGTSGKVVTFDLLFSPSKYWIICLLESTLLKYTRSEKWRKDTYKNNEKRKKK